MNPQEIKDYLYTHADERYAAFSSALMPGEKLDVIGVRLPVIKDLAKRLSKEDWKAYLDSASDDTFEEIMLQGFVIGLAKMPFEEQLRRIAGYADKITNWSLCDSLVPVLSLFVNTGKRFGLFYSHICKVKMSLSNVLELSC